MLTLAHFGWWVIHVTHHLFLYAFTFPKNHHFLKSFFISPRLVSSEYFFVFQSTSLLLNVALQTKSQITYGFLKVHNLMMAALGPFTDSCPGALSMEQSFVTISQHFFGTVKNKHLHLIYNSWLLWGFNSKCLMSWLAKYGNEFYYWYRNKIFRHKRCSMNHFRV